MESLARILGAFSAQKLPTQQQINAWIDLLLYQIDQVSTGAKESGPGVLSERGLRLANDLKQFLLAYKELGSRKNHDNVLQSAIYNLSHGELKPAPSAVEAQNEAVTDAQRASAAFKDMLYIFWRHLTSTSGTAGDFASFTRNFLADTAEVVERHASAVKSGLRQTEEEVQEGKRDPLGRTSAADASDNLRERYERGMDAAKVTGSKVIGAGQAVKHDTDQLRSKSAQNLDELIDNMLQRAENDQEYRNSVSTIFDLASKWFNRTVDAADKASVDEFVHDPSGRIPSALESLNTLLERLASNKSTRDLKHAFRTAALDIRNDPELRDYFNQVHDFVRRTISEPRYVRSTEHDQRRKELCDHWRKLQTGEHRRKWHDDLEHLRNEICQFSERIQNDQDVKRLQEASVILGKDFSDAIASLNEAVLGQANWFWQDIADVYLPRAVEALRNIPIPRTEYKDNEVEFVLEDLVVEKLQLLPGHGHIRNTTDMDIVKESTEAEADTKVKSHTQLHFKGVEFKVNDLSFWYRDPSLSPISEVSGLLGIDVPKHGLDVDISLGLIPQPEKKDVDRKQHAFFKIDRVNVRLNEPSISIRRSNHQVLFTAFKPIVRNRLLKSIEATLANQIIVAIECMDNIAYDVCHRAQIFRDTGLNPTASYMGAIWSKIGQLKREPGLFSGLRTTSVGVIRDDPRLQAKFAVGAQPQIISGDKHGPVAPGSESQVKREQATRLAMEAKGRAQAEGQRVASGAVTFTEEVKIKKEAEERNPDWKSRAFDPPTLQ